MVKLDVDTVPTVPDAPPAAGPDRALDAPPAAPLPWRPADAEAEAEGDVVVDDGDEAVVVAEAAQPAKSPITAHTAPAVSHLRFDSNRRTLGRRSCLATITGADGGLVGS
jgi:hypothetical protein